MFKNYFKTAFRNLARNKAFSFINIIGLSIGISAALVIFLIVQYDFSFEKFEKDKDKIYRVVSNYTFSGIPAHNSGVPYPMHKVVPKEITGLELSVPFSTWDDDTKISIPAGTGKDPAVFKKQKHIVFADENYFKLLSYQWLAGSSKTALAQPNQVVLTESNAKLYFAKQTPADIIGRELIFNDTVRTTVSGVVKDLGEITDFTFTTFVSVASMGTVSLKPNGWTEWGSTSSSSQLFVKLAPGSMVADIEKKINALHRKYEKPNPEDHSTTDYALQPLNDIHFNGIYDTFDQRLAHKPTLYGLLAVAAFLLMLGCINFINLTTAQGSQRAKEIGIRKTMGSSRKQLISQFLSETFLLTLTAGILSVLITPLLLKVFADFIPEGLHFSIQGSVLLFLAALIVTVSLLSGFYPAIILSSYNPVMVLKGQPSTAIRNARNTSFKKSFDNRVTICATEAPITLRTPISLVRWLVI